MEFIIDLHQAIKQRWKTSHQLWDSKQKIVNISFRTWPKIVKWLSWVHHWELLHTNNYEISFIGEVGHIYKLYKWIHGQTSAGDTWTINTFSIQTAIKYVVILWEEIVFIQNQAWDFDGVQFILQQITVMHFMQCTIYGDMLHNGSCGELFSLNHLWRLSPVVSRTVLRIPPYACCVFWHLCDSWLLRLVFPSSRRAFMCSFPLWTWSKACV